MLILFALSGLAVGTLQPQDTSQALRAEVAQMRVEAAGLEARAVALEARIAALEGRPVLVGDASAIPPLESTPVPAPPQNAMILDGASGLDVYGQVQFAQSLRGGRVEEPLDQTYAGIAFVADQTRYVAEVGFGGSSIELDRAFVENGEFLLGQTDSLIVDPASLYGGQANHSPQTSDAGRLMPTSQRLFRPQIRWDNGKVAISIEQDDTQGRSLAVSHRWLLANDSRLSTTAFGRENRDGSTGYGLSLSGRLNWEKFSIGGLLLGGHNAGDMLDQGPVPGENFLLTSFNSEQRWTPRFRTVISIGAINHSDSSVFYPRGSSFSGSGYAVYYSDRVTNGDKTYTASATALISVTDQIDLGLEYRHQQTEAFSSTDYELISSTGIVPPFAVLVDQISEQNSKRGETFLFIRSSF